MDSSIDSEDSSILSKEELELEQPGKHLANTLLIGGCIRAHKFAPDVLNSYDPHDIGMADCHFHYDYTLLP